MKDPDPARNLRLLAERGNWPAGALASCIVLGSEYPRWTIYWSRGGLPLAPEPGFRAAACVRGRHYREYGETARKLRERLAVADLALDDPWA